MTNREWFETMAAVGETCDHGETCHNCRERIELGRIVREYLRREDTGEDAVVRCMKEFGERMRSLPSLN